MRFALASEHRDFFYKNHFIEFEELFTLEQIHSLKEAIQAALCQRLQMTPYQIEKKNGLELFRDGYDLWRESDPVKKMSQKKSLLKVAADLFQKQELKIAFDQYIATQTPTQAPFAKATTLSEISCLKPLVGILLIQLKDQQEPVLNFPLPLKAGNALFFSPDFPLPWPLLFATSGLSFYLIAFGEDGTLFRADTIDPHATVLKKLGYTFGDHLKNDLHPTIFKN